MGLKVWLPLNGDLKNLGCGDITYTGTPVYKDTSKIGAKSLNLATRISCNCPQLNGLKKFSITLWAKVNTDTSLSTNWVDIITFTDQTPNGTKGLLRWETCYANNAAHRGASWHDNTTYAITPANTLSGSQGTGAKDRWEHLTITVDNDFRVYRNGALECVCAAAGGHLTGAFNIGETNLINGEINDIRIYDHCLSAAEVHEIAQGLILHYKLNNNINIGNNLLPNSLEMNLGTANASTGTWRIAGTSNMSRARVAITDTPEGSGYGFQNSGIQTANDGSCYGIDKFPLEPNTVYIISMWARIIEGTEGYAGFNIYSSTPINGWSKIERNYYLTQLSSQGEWTKCYMTFMTNASTTRNIYIGITTGDTSVTTQMCNVHIEKGIIQDNTIQDNSGYGHQANLQTGTSLFTVDTVRYNSSLATEKTTCYRVQDTIFNSQHLASDFTWAGWIKRGYTTAETSYIYKGIVYIYLGDEFDIRIAWRHRNEDGSYDSNNAWAPGIIISYNEWTHITFTFKDGIMKLYVNGEYTRMSDRSETGIYIRGYRNFYFPSNSGDSFVGNISDIRIYCTALLDTDIKLLYNISSKIDNLGGVHSFELEEKDNNLLAGTLITSAYGNRTNPYTKYNSNGEMYFDTNGTSAGSSYISINPTNHIYYYDFDISVNAGNQFYIGFERYDADKTGRTNAATVYVYTTKATEDVNHKHIFGTVNLSTDGVNPCAFIALRILNGWSGTNSGVVGAATIHSMSLREISNIQNPKLYKNGILSTGEFKEYQKASFYKNGFVEATEFIEI